MVVRARPSLLTREGAGTQVQVVVVVAASAAVLLLALIVRIVCLLVNVVRVLASSLWCASFRDLAIVTNLLTTFAHLIQHMVAS